MEKEVVIIDKPREIILNEISFNENEVSLLKGMFKTQSLIKLAKEDIVKCAELQKALKASAVVFLGKKDAYGLVELNLTQAGKKLIERV